MSAATAATTTDSLHNASETTTAGVSQVSIHPLVLLSAADHYHRVARGTRKRVVGILLGKVSQGLVEATNSYAVPFEEDSKNPAVFYLDHNFLENMLGMFRKIAAKEVVVGFYSTGPQIRPNDLRIYDIVKRYVKSGGANNTANGAQEPAAPVVAKADPPAVFCIIDVRPDRPDLPVTAYQVATTTTTSGTNKNNNNNSKVQRSWQHVPVQMGALEAEEIGVEHLLRDINDPTVSTTASLIKAQLSGLETLTEKLVECKDYLQQAAAGQITPHPTILANLQTILALLPNLETPALIHALLKKTNDYHMSIYLAAMIRSVMALHDLVNNKIRYGDAAQEEEEKKEDEKPVTTTTTTTTAATTSEKKESK